MSNERTSSAVRNLRTIFENKASEGAANDSRGRSPSGFPTSRENSRPHSKIRTSFVPVDLAAGMAELMKEDSASGRRSSFVEGEQGGPMTDAKIVLGQVREERLNDVNIIDPIPETAIESAAPTPGLNSSAQLGDSTEENADGKAETKHPLAGATKAVKKTADKVATKATLASRSSIGHAKPSQSSTTTNPKPTTQPIRSNRSSLTAPTAASAARAAAASEKPAADSSPARTKQRETTKPVEISSRLTAPTAASKAKFEPERPVNGRPSLGRPTKAATSTRQTPRSSLAPGQRPGSSASQDAGSKKSVVADSSFLDRMSRPTAASQNRLSDKPAETKTPPRAKAVAPAPKPKVNGAVKAANAPKAGAAGIATGAPQSGPDADVQESDIPAVEENEPIQSDAPADSAAGADDVPVEAEPVPEPATEPEPEPVAEPQPEPVKEPEPEPEVAPEPAVVAQPEPEVEAHSTAEPVVEPVTETEAAPEAEPAHVPKTSAQLLNPEEDAEVKPEAVTASTPTEMKTKLEPEPTPVEAAPIQDGAEPVSAKKEEVESSNTAESVLAAPEEDEPTADFAAPSSSIATEEEKHAEKTETVEDKSAIPPLDGPTADALAATPAFNDSKVE